MRVLSRMRWDDERTHELATQPCNKTRGGWSAGRHVRAAGVGRGRAALTWWMRVGRWDRLRLHGGWCSKLMNSSETI
jgi:hypothetical protein